MSLSLMHKQRFPEIDTQKMMDDGPNNLAENRTNNCQLGHQLQITPVPMPESSCDHTPDPTKKKYANK